jgi:hypothetical protein
VLASFFGLDFSFHYDFPAGSSIVAVLGGIFILASIIKLVKGWSLKLVPKKMIREEDPERSVATKV